MPKSMPHAALLCFTFTAFLMITIAHAADSGQLQYFRQYRRCPKCDLRKAEFNGLDLSGSKVQEANFSGSSFYKTNLRDSDFTGAKFEGVRIHGCWLKGAVGLDLTGATTDETTECPDGSAGPCH